MPAARDTARPTARDARETAGLLFAIGDQLRRGFENAAARFGLTAQQARTLLACDEPVPMHSLAGHMGCDASNVTGIADRLEARGLVARRADPADRRVKLLALTEAGTDLRRRLDAAVVEASPLIAGLTTEELATLRALLVKAGGHDPAGGVCGPAPVRPPDARVVPASRRPRRLGGSGRPGNGGHREGD